MRKTPSVKSLCAVWPNVPAPAWQAWKDAARTGTRRAIMEAANVLLEGYGVEAILDPETRDTYRCHALMEYVNMGDTYTSTLMMHRSGSVTIGCWGDWVESMERRGVHFD
jgi:hypothetical protein